LHRAKSWCKVEQFEEDESIMSMAGLRLLALGGAVLATTAIALPAAMGAMSRADRIRETQLSDSLLGQFTPAAGDPRLIARYAKVSDSARRMFTFTPALPANGDRARAITVVVRAGEASRAQSDGARAASLLAPNAPVQPVAITPVVYSLGASVGFERFVAPGIGRKVDIAALPDPRSADAAARKPSRFATRVGTRPDDPVGSTPRAANPALPPAVELGSSYRISKNIDVTAGVRYKAEGDAPLTDSKRDSQAVYVGTQFRF
jgi:hypothetical protein